MYDGLVLIDREADISLEQLADELRQFYNGYPGAPASIDLIDDTVALRWPGYTFEFGKSCEPHVIEESVELAAKFAAHHPKRDRIAQCRCRFEWGGDADSDMEHFNDSLFIGEALERLGAVCRFDQASTEFLN